MLHLAAQPGVRYSIDNPWAYAKQIWMDFRLSLRLVGLAMYYEPAPLLEESNRPPATSERWCLQRDSSGGFAGLETTVRCSDTGDVDDL